MRERDVRYNFRKKLMIAGVVCFLLGFGTSLPGGNDGFVPIVRGGGGVTDHGALTGLLDDDHPQYGVTGHPHDQDLNQSSSPTFQQPVVTSINVSDYVFHHGDADTYISFLTNKLRMVSGGLVFLDCIQAATNEVVVNDGSEDVDFRVESDGFTSALHVTGSNGCVGIGTESDGNILHIKRTTANTWCKFDTQNTNGWSGLVLQNDAETFYIALNDAYDIVIRDPSASADAITVEGSCADHMLYLNSPSQICMFQTVGSLGKETDLNGDHEATSYNPVSDIRCKTIVLDLNEIGDNLVLKLCRFIDYYVFQWKNPYFVDYVENGTVFYKPFNAEGYGVSCIAQWLYDDLLNFTDNEQLNYKIANGIVSVGDENNEWSINKDNLAMIYHRAWQITDEMLLENIMHTKHMESWLGRFGYNPLDWD